MKASLLNRLDTLSERFEELSALLSDAEVISDQDRFRAYSKEYAELEATVKCYESWRSVKGDLEEARSLLKDSDPDLREMAEEDAAASEAQLVELEEELNRLLLPKDPNDGRNVFLEVRAGTGGDEAAIFAGDLFRMYSRYAERQGWRIEILSENQGEHGGYKEIIARVEGQSVYAKLKFESGAHRVQRVPATESQGRIHTSACTVAILPEMDAQAKLVNQQREAQDKEISDTRRSLVGSGDRSERIRTYNFPQGRVTDHRINLTLYSLDEVIQGGLDAVVEPLLREYQADQLAALENA